jgi:hypothetical protein
VTPPAPGTPTRRESRPSPLGKTGAIGLLYTRILVVREGWFVSAESGYALVTRGDIEDAGFERAASSRHPGLDWFDREHALFLRRYEPSLDAMLFQVKRAAWLTFVHEVAVQALGGAGAIRAKLAADPAILVRPLAHGLVIQGGPALELGDLSRHDVSVLQRRVARVLNAVRLRSVPLAYREDFVEHWFVMFDRDYPEGSPP